MYFSQSINVRLVRENVDVLKRPSKVFNKLKSLLSGEMTPTELQQAYVMLSVLQRLNVALRQSGFEDLVRIRANDTVLYEDDGRTSGDLRAGPEALERGLRESTVGRIDTLELTVDGRGDGLRYLVEVRIARRPKSGSEPVRVDVLGFIEALQQIDEESDDAFAERINVLLKADWNESGGTERLSELESTFAEMVRTLQVNIDGLFPARSTESELRKSLRAKPMRRQDERYNSACAYIPLWFAYFDAEGSSVYDDFDLDDGDDSEWESEDDVNKSGFWSDDVSLGELDGGSDASGCGSGCGGGCSS